MAKRNIKECSTERLNDFSVFLQRGKTLIREGQIDEDVERGIKKEKRRDFLLTEQVYAPRKENFYRQISNWRNYLLSAYERQVEEIFEIINPKKEIDIFGGWWGHTRPDNRNKGCWSFVSMDRKGTLIYKAGYKFMGINTKFEIDGDTEKLSCDYFKNLADAVTSGKVYVTMQSELGNVISEKTGLRL